jgi:hypothetical protein
MKTILMSLSMVMGCLLVSGKAETLYVFPPNPDDAQPIKIQDVINSDLCVDGSEIIVAPGTYYEQNINLSGKSIKIRSTNPLDPAATIIDCEGFFSGFIFDKGETASTIIDGFTIIHSSWGYGGAFVCMFDSEFTLRGSSPTIRNCVITNNMAWSDGAGLYCDTECNPVVENCTFVINTSGLSGGAVSISGGNPVFNNCQFVKNSSGLSGGAISIYGGNPLFTNCQFRENSTLYWGGAVYAFGGSPVFRNCVIAGNYADAGAAFWFDTTDQPQILGCTVIDNTAGSFVSGVYANSSQGLTIENSLFWGNVVLAKSTNLKTIDISGQIENTTRLAYCDIQNLATAVGYDPLYTTVEGLMDNNPLFVLDGSFTQAGEYTPGDWHLQKRSPCINAGNPAYVALPDEKDIDGEQRVMNGRVEIGVDEVEMAIAAKIDIVPGRLIVPCKGFVLAMIRLPEGYAVKDINAKSILWNGKLAARCLEKCRCNAIAVFDLDKVSDLLDDVEGKVGVTISGQLANGMAFAGSDIVQVHQIHWKNWFKRLCHSACKNHSACKK